MRGWTDGRVGQVGQVGRARRTAFAGLAGLLVLALSVSACGRRDQVSSKDAPRAPQIVARSGLAMGSSLTVMAWTADQDTANRAFDAVFAEFDRLDHLMSVWKDGSDIVRLNGAAGDHAVSISADTMAVLQSGQQASEWTQGKFDVTFAALSDLWKFDQDQDDSIPTRAQIAPRLALIDYRRLILDPGAGTAFLQRKGMRVNVGGVGKGYAVDKGVAILRSAGLHDFSVQAGGDLYVAGTRGDRPWRLGIADPRAPDGAVFARVELGDSAFSTAGDYERFFIKDGVRYHHILDPATGEPSRLCRSVTIAAKTATIADAVDDGVFLLGPEAGMALIEKLPDVEGVIVGADNQVHVSSGLKGKVEIVHPPTDGL